LTYQFSVFATKQWNTAKLPGERPLLVASKGAWPSFY